MVSFLANLCITKQIIERIYVQVIESSLMEVAYMLKSLSLFGKVNLFAGILFFIFGIFLLVKELMEGSFVIYQSIGIAMLSLSIALFFGATLYKK